MEAQEQNEIKIGISLPTNGYFLSGIRDFTMTLARNMTGFSDKWAHRFQVVVDELASNAIEHGCSEGDEIKITFLAKKGESLAITVEDPGHGPDKVTADQLKELFNQKIDSFSKQQFLGIRGRGLAQIIHPWSDEMVFEDSETGGIRVKVIKYLKEGEGVINADMPLNSMQNPVPVLAQD